MKYLQSINFSQITLNLKNRNKRKRKVRYKQIRQEQRIHTTRQFNISVYLKWGWLCGCEEKDAQIDSTYKLSIVKHNEEKKKKCVVQNNELG